MTFYIKNMVCDRCKLVVKNELERMGCTVLSVGLGEVTVDPGAGLPDTEQLANVLRSYGLDLQADRKTQLVADLKGLLSAFACLDYPETEQPVSAFLAERLPFSYRYLSAVFSGTMHCSMEKFLLELKIDRVKALIDAGNSVTSIAERMGYSSVAHLSSQFKKVTGLTPSSWKHR